MPDVEFFCNWPKSDIEAMDDKTLMEEAKYYKEDIDYEWEEI